jgi:hypothetical protein
MKTLISIILTTVSISFLCAFLVSDHKSIIREEGFVPDSTTAVNVAIAILSPIYGREDIELEKPFHAVLINGIWIVEGTNEDRYTEGFVGGIAHIEIRKKDCKVMKVWHDR